MFKCMTCATSHTPNIFHGICCEIGIDVAVGVIQLVNWRKVMEHCDALYMKTIVADTIVCAVRRSI
jgi:hypothetical protein